jgi:hypothetical protein
VACEGIPALFSFGIDLHATTGISLPLSGNPLDVAFVTTSPSSWAAIVSVDNVHKPASTTEFREDKVRMHTRSVASGRLMRSYRARRGYSITRSREMDSGAKLRG